jgi:hypothetical protein
MHTRHSAITNPILGEVGDDRRLCCHVNERCETNMHYGDEYAQGVESSALGRWMSAPCPRISGCASDLGIPSIGMLTNMYCIGGEQLCTMFGTVAISGCVVTLHRCGAMLCYSSPSHRVTSCTLSWQTCNIVTAHPPCFPDESASQTEPHVTRPVLSTSLAVPFVTTMPRIAVQSFATIIERTMGRFLSA